MSDRNLSTSFRAGPPSPFSPAAESLKENRQLPVSSDHIPQTPTSPPLMSVSDQCHVSPSTSNQALPNQATTQPPNTSSPPSSTPMSTQLSQQPTVSATNSFPTPASSVSGHPTNATSTEDTDHKISSTGMQDATKHTEEKTDQYPAQHLRTEHDRQSLATTSEPGVQSLATETGQGLPDVDAMDLDKEPISRAENRGLGLDSLQKDFTSTFHLCKSCKKLPKFDCSGRDSCPLHYLGMKFVNTLIFVA